MSDDNHVSAEQALRNVCRSKFSRTGIFPSSTRCAGGCVSFATGCALTGNVHRNARSQRFRSVHRYARFSKALRPGALYRGAVRGGHQRGERRSHLQVITVPAADRNFGKECYLKTANFARKIVLALIKKHKFGTMYCYYII